MSIIIKIDESRKITAQMKQELHVLYTKMNEVQEQSDKIARMLSDLDYKLYMVEKENDIRS